MESEWVDCWNDTNISNVSRGFTSDATYGHGLDWMGTKSSQRQES